MRLLKDNFWHFELIKVFLPHIVILILFYNFAPLYRNIILLYFLITTQKNGRCIMFIYVQQKNKTKKKQIQRKIYNKRIGRYYICAHRKNNKEKENKKKYAQNGNTSTYNIH